MAISSVSSTSTLIGDMLDGFDFFPSKKPSSCSVQRGPSSRSFFLGPSGACQMISGESRLISDRMKHLLYDVPVRVAGGLLFELLGQSVGDPLVEEDDIPIVLRSWQAQNFLVTAMHMKGSVSSVNVLGITEVQELLSAGGYNVPRTVHEVIAQLACRLTRWDDRLFRKYIFGAADEVELKFVNRFPRLFRKYIFRYTCKALDEIADISIPGIL